MSQTVRDSAAHADMVVPCAAPCSSIKLTNGHARDNDEEVLPTAVERCIHDMVVENVARSHDKSAVVGWDETLTYAELDRLSTRLALHLASLGVGPGYLVPISFEKSAWAVVGMLAVLKAGGGFVPLNPSHPSHRLAGIVDEVGAKVLLTSVELLATIAGLSRAAATQVVSRSAIDALDLEPQATLPASSPTDLAYAIFTSGSTGKPKGVMVEHRSFVSAATAWSDRLGVDGETRFFQFSNFTFDASIMEIFAPLLRGGCVCVPREQDIYGHVERPLAEMGATHFGCAPSYLQLLAPDMLESMPALKTIVLGGEMVHGDLVVAWAQHVALFIQYGPTECAVWCSVTHALDAAADNATGLIGEPIACRYWLVQPDDHDTLVPAGAIGELVVEGPVVARGYINDQAKTDRAFIRPPAWAGVMAKVDGRRFYVTGDLVRRRPGGGFVMLGRKDTQFKIRGHLVEAGEIEHHLRSHWAARRWAVSVDLLQPDAAAAPRLVAFVSTADSAGTAGEAPEIQWWMAPSLGPLMSEASRFLRTVLPGFMVPSLFVPLQRFPTTTSGKTDRKALRQAGLALRKEQVDFLLGSIGEPGPARNEARDAARSEESRRQRPLSDMEARLAELWVDVLQYSGTITADDALVSLGGDSMVAIRLSAAAFAAGIALDAVAIIRNPVLGDMARQATLIYGADGEASNLDAAPFELVGGSADAAVQALVQQAAAMTGSIPAAVEDLYPCLSFQTFTTAQSLAAPSGFVSQFLFRFAEGLDVPRFEAAWRAVLHDAQILRTRCVPWDEERGFVQAVLKHEFVLHRARDLERYLDEDRARGMRLGEALSRFALVEADGGGDASPIFVLTIHHAIFDGHTLNLILGAVEQRYRGQPLPSPLVPYSRYLKAAQDPPRREAADRFWHARLAGAALPAFPDLERKAAAPERSSAGRRMAVHALGIASPAFFPSTVLRTALVLTLSHMSRTDDVLFIDVLGGRESGVVQGIDRVLGPTVTPTPLRMRVPAKTTTARFLEAVQADYLERIAHTPVDLLRLARAAPQLAAPKTLLDIRHASTSAFTNGLFEPAGEGADAGGSVLGVPLLLACVVGGGAIESVEYLWDEDVLSADDMAAFQGQFEGWLARLVREENRDVALESLLDGPL